MTQNTPLIQEVYKDYTPPINALKTVEVLLGYVPPEDLAHLQSIVLTNTAALSRERKRQRTSTGAPVSRVRGLYSQAWNRQPAYIEIFVDNTLNSGSWYDQKLPILRKMMFGEVLYHEIGHHVQYMSKSKLVKREAFADKYAARLGKGFLRQSYRYLRPFVPLLLLILNPILWLIGKISLVKKSIARKS